MILGENQQFESPGEALAHYGVKGMRWGFRKKRDSEFESFGRPYDKKTDGIHGGIDDLKLRKTKGLRVDTSDGFAHVRSERGFKSEQARANYEGVVAEFKVYREQYPKLKNLDVEIVPMSHMKGRTSGRLQAAVLHADSGKVQLMYNDNVKDFSERDRKMWASWVPGMQYPGYAGRHEMGHVLAAAANTLPPTGSIYREKNVSKRISKIFEYDTVTDQRHEATFKKHGLTFQELGQLGNYAKTSRAEAYAEAFGAYHTPQLNAKMSPALRTKIKAMLDDEGGAT